jgi:hypothetical protein
MLSAHVRTTPLPRHLRCAASLRRVASSRSSWLAGRLSMSSAGSADSLLEARAKLRLDARAYERSGPDSGRLRVGRKERAERAPPTRARRPVERPKVTGIAGDAPPDRIRRQENRPRSPRACSPRPQRQTQSPSLHPRAGHKPHSPSRLYQTAGVHQSFSAPASPLRPPFLATK